MLIEKRSFAYGIITIFGELSCEHAAAACRKILESTRYRKQLEIQINSPGGDLSAGMAIYNIMQLTKAKTKTLCCGQAHSVASLLLAAGCRGYRMCVAGASIALH